MDTPDHILTQVIRGSQPLPLEMSLTRGNVFVKFMVEFGLEYEKYSDHFAASLVFASDWRHELSITTLDQTFKAEAYHLNGKHLRVAGVNRVSCSGNVICQLESAREFEIMTFAPYDRVLLGGRISGQGTMATHQSQVLEDGELI